MSSPHTDEERKAFMRAVGEDEWFESDPRFADGESRTQHVEALYEMLADKLKAKTTRMARAARAARHPGDAGATFEFLMDDPHLQDIGFFQNSSIPPRACRDDGCRARPQSPLPPLRPPPLLGEHSAQAAGRAGYPPQQIREMVHTGVAQVTTAARN